MPVGRTIADVNFYNDTKIIASIAMYKFKNLNSIDQCSSTGGPRSYLCGPPNFSHFVLNCNFLHKYCILYEKPALLALNASRNEKISQFYLHERDRKKLKKIMVGCQNVFIYL
jgi:hypothetical protein